MSLVGRTGSKWRFPVEWTKVREFARAVHDDHAEAEEIPVPPTFPTYGTQAFETLDYLAELDLRRVLHGEQECEYRRPLRVGDRLVCQTRIVEDYMKEGRRGGKMRFIVAECEMRDERSGELVVRARTTVIETAPQTEEV